MPTPFKLTKKKENEFRRKKAAFKKLTDEGQKRTFLANCEWWPMEFWQASHKGFRWYATAVGIIMLDDEHPIGFETAEEANTYGLLRKAEYAAAPAAQPGL